MIRWCPLTAESIPAIIVALRSKSKPPRALPPRLRDDLHELLLNYLALCDNPADQPASVRHKIQSLVDKGPLAFTKWKSTSRTLLRGLLAKARAQHCDGCVGGRKRISNGENDPRKFVGRDGDKTKNSNPGEFDAYERRSPVDPPKSIGTAGEVVGAEQSVRPTGGGGGDNITYRRRNR